MKPEPLSCMGGWCPVRDRCELHLQPTAHVSERLCRKGLEQPEAMRAITVEALRARVLRPSENLMDANHAL